jgi:tRNA (adenine22-N1)-methyltransferase
MPHLDQRLKTVARQIRWHVHADIGSDHGHLIQSLLAAGRIQRGIAIENKQQPLENSQATLANLNVDVRLADGLDGLQSGEADGVSICGMGGRAMVRILDKHPRRIPINVVLQPNRDSDHVRRWGLRTGHRLVDEQLSGCARMFQILRFQRATGTPANDIIDPAYRDIDREAAILFGPHLLRRNAEPWKNRLQEELVYLQSLNALSVTMKNRRDAIIRIL